jgi:hypothetical protein
MDLFIVDALEAFLLVKTIIHTKKWFVITPTAPLGDK